MQTLHVVVAATVILASIISAAPLQHTSDEAVYIAYYWRAKPGKLADYNAYIKEYAEPIDEEARKAGAFEELRTYLAPPPTEGQPPQWTHLRVFKLKNAAAADALSNALDAATKKVRTDAERSAATARAGTLRDFVRQERWTELR